MLLFLCASLSATVSVNVCFGQSVQYSPEQPLSLSAFTVQSVLLLLFITSGYMQRNPKEGHEAAMHNTLSRIAKQKKFHPSFRYSGSINYK